jgi:predicted permease
MKLWPWRGRRAARERELNREIEWHLNEIREEREADGLSPRQAVHAARRDFGNDALVREDTRQVWGWLWLARLAQDGHYALRLLARSPGFSATAVLVFGLGIGANTAVFSLVNSLLLRTLPVEKPGQLVLLATQRQTGDPSSDFTYPEYREFAAHTNSYQGVFGFSLIDALKVSFQGGSETATGVQVSGSFFETLGVHAAAGRVLTADDERISGLGLVCVISHDYWRRKFSADPDAIGKIVRLNDRPYTLVGVVEPEFHGVQIGDNPDVFVLIAQFSPDLVQDPHTWFMSAAARLKPGVNIAQASAELDALYQRRRHPEGRQPSPLGSSPRDYMLATPFSRGQSPVGAAYSKPLAILMGAVGLVLIIACANLANMLLARAEARRKEMAVRVAIGAGRGRVIRQLLTESLILAAAGTALGLFFAQWSSSLLVRLAGDGPKPFALDLHPDITVLGFTTAVAIATALLFGLAPAIRATRIDPYRELKGAGPSVSRGPGGGPGSALVVFQIALSVALTIGGGLLARTLGNLRSFDAGFDRENLLFFAIEPATSGYSGDRLMNLYAEVVERLQSLPGVKSASMSRFRPMTPGRFGGRIQIPDDPNPGTPRSLQGNAVDDRFFETFHMPIVRGRGFNRADAGTAPQVAILNETAAREFFGGQNPLGRRFFMRGAKPIEVVGIVRDARYHDLREPPVRMAYFPYQQGAATLERMHFAIRATRDAAALAPEIRALMRELVRNVPVVDMNTLTEQIDRTLLRERLLATLSSFFAGLGLIVAAAGLYGLMAFRVTRRRPEIGIRTALGAQRSDILALILREALVLVSTGAAAGLLLAWPATKLLSSLLFGLGRFDAATIGGAVGCLVAASLLAAYLPARRALRIEAVTALRYE